MCSRDSASGRRGLAPTHVNRGFKGVCWRTGSLGLAVAVEMASEMGPWAAGAVPGVARSTCALGLTVRRGPGSCE